MTNSVIFQFIQTPDNASSEWYSWGSRLCFHSSSLVQKKSKLWRFICQSWGFLNCHRTGWFLTALEAENGFPARCTRETERRSPGCTLTSADTGLFLEEQSGDSLCLFHRNTTWWLSVEVLYCGIHYTIFLYCGIHYTIFISILWDSPTLLIEIPVSFGGNSTDIHKAAELVNKQCLLLTKLWGILPWSSMRISSTTITTRKEGN